MSKVAILCTPLSMLLLPPYLRVYVSALFLTPLSDREPCPARPGDYWEFFAEVDVLCALSTCPGGDLSAWGWGESSSAAAAAAAASDEQPSPPLDMLDCCRPLAVEVFDMVDRDSILKEWKSPEVAAYKGFHGLGQPVFSKK